LNATMYKIDVKLIFSRTGFFEGTWVDY
jgi:hypothetical protein